ncbi:Transcriptional regulatory protein BasR [Anaerobiospirillum thomasii]|uniref:Transcriptional regulatory protein BasR n=1 Tax=Anaerobiospirillum thomasii TaxID=179995 RepID=A0A2X0X2L9_9GAMM|nr:response regulator [Anaerobiospirillum thomasii]SPT69433.1 Transcriptional regulatory protein BasR [Anaerobiospirillum thomasii]SPT72001.1 Transcriptional regulatory protein BasR [Anaerobiospirillum thomasii]
MRILVVEDDPMIGSAVCDALSKDNYAVDLLTNGTDAQYAPLDVDYDCILLDLGLPGIDGVTLLMRWRESRLKTPVIILTARDAIDDRVNGLDRGADDYLVKPFELSELKARIRAVTRRLGTNVQSVLTNGPLSLNVLEHEVSITEDGKTRVVDLTAREFSLLEALIIRPGAVLSREALEQKIYSFDEEVESNAVEYIIHTLRKKIGASYIKNVRGVGWKVAKES